MTDALLLALVVLLIAIFLAIPVLLLNLIRKATPFFKEAAFKFRRTFYQYEIRQKHSFYLSNFYDEVYDYIAELELDYNVSLSEEAKQLLILPLLELKKMVRSNSNSDIHIQTRLKNDLEYWRVSLSKIMETIKNEPAQIDNNEYTFDSKSRSALSVIKAFASRFCNIPPFCGERSM